jgi:hypothetical protein
MVKSKGMEYRCGMMVTPIMDNGKMVLLRDMEFLQRRMEMNFMESLSEVISRERDLKKKEVYYTELSMKEAR